MSLNYALAVAPAGALGFAAGAASFGSLFSVFSALSAFSAEAVASAAAGEAVFSATPASVFFGAAAEPFSDFLLSLIYQPEPLKTTPTG